MSGQPAAPLSVVVPAWNEADRIRHCLEQVRKRLGHLGAEIIVVDDGSSDGTAEVCAAWMRQHPGAPVVLLSLPHRGKGSALRAGALASRGTVVAFIDADLDIPAEEVARLVRLRADRGLDIVVGSKLTHGGRRPARPLGRRVLSVLFRCAVRLLFRLPVGDTQTGVKVFDGRWLRVAAQHARVSGFLFDLELLTAAAADGLRMAEVPVDVTMRRPASRLRPRDILRSCRELWQVRGSAGRVRRTLRAGTPVQPAARARALPPRSAAASRGTGLPRRSELPAL